MSLEQENLWKVGALEFQSRCSADDFGLQFICTEQYAHSVFIFIFLFFKVKVWEIFTRIYMYIYIYTPVYLYTCVHIYVDVSIYVYM